MAVLLGLYYLLLEREKMHRFNRFYLLGALLISLVIPFITIPVYVEAAALPPASLQIAQSSDVISTPIPETNYGVYAIGTVYMLVTAALLIRFITNLLAFRRKIKANATVNYHGAKLVLLAEEIAPHTFLNFIFINKFKHQKGMIEQELYTHELVHAHQKHTADIIFIEMIKTLFWFNPLLYCYKKAIQLNHEFLADDAVVKVTNDTAYYQELLLQTASTGYSASLASSLNFSLTKKRFTMMARSTSKTKKAILQGAILPVICTLATFMCMETVAQQTPITVDYSKAGKIEILTPTQKELDSLREIDPILYKDEPNTRILRADYTVVENGKEKVIKTYDKQQDYKTELSEKTMNGIAGIDHKKIKSININNVSEAEMDSLRSAEPNYYRNANAADYKSITIVYLENDKQVKRTYYEAHITPNMRDNDQPQDKLPKFSEGDFHAYISRNLKLPAIKDDLDVKVFVSFTVETDGSLSDIKIIRDPGYGLGDAVRKAVEGSPKWSPGTKDGKPARVAYSLPIRIMVKN